MLYATALSAPLHLLYSSPSSSSASSTLRHRSPTSATTRLEGWSTPSREEASEDYVRARSRAASRCGSSTPPCAVSSGPLGLCLAACRCPFTRLATASTLSLRPAWTPLRANSLSASHRQSRPLLVPLTLARTLRRPNRARASTYPRQATAHLPQLNLHCTSCDAAIFCCPRDTLQSRSLLLRQPGSLLRRVNSCGYTTSLRRTRHPQRRRL